MRILRRLLGWLRPRTVESHTPEVAPGRGPVDHIVILDGTLSSLEPGWETNAGRAWRVLARAARCTRCSLYYEAGLQWVTWRQAGNVIQGRGIDDQIRRTYGFLASRYRPGDRIFLFGYSRGAFAVRSLAGLIDRVGLLRPADATERNLRQAYRHYRMNPDSAAARVFAANHCHPKVEIEVLGVWDTVAGLGLRPPLVGRFLRPDHAFHDLRLGANVRCAFQALALDETRRAFAPLLWEAADPHTRVEQVWFRGAHPDVGGQVSGYEAARPLTNIPLVWMLERAETCGLVLPEGWRDAFPCDVTAPMVGTMRRWGKFFLIRQRRVVGRGVGEAIHPSALPALRTSRARMGAGKPPLAGEPASLPQA